jgi:hypothetical protein
MAALTVSRLEERPRYDVICAWCQVDGVRNVVRQSEIANSHGICAEHALAVLEESALRPLAMPAAHP